MAIDFPSDPSHGDVFGAFTYDENVPGWRSTPESASGMPAGSIMAWGSDTPPTNWLICNGSAVSRTTYASLFAAVGVTYGVGDGATTFNLPDLRGKVPVGKDSTQSEFDILGETGGNKSQAKYGDGTTTGYGATYSSSLGSGDSTGSNLPPYQVVQYIIKFSAGVSAGDTELATRLAVVENKFNTGQNDAPAGAIVQFGGTTAPTNWLLCDGSAVSRAAWPSLYSAIGTTYGAGDGSTTFNVPDLRGRVAVGKDSATFSTLGFSGGTETHRHEYKLSLWDSGYTATASNAAMGNPGGANAAGAWRYSTSAWQGAYGADSQTQTRSTASFASGTTQRMTSTGDTDLGSSLQPYQVVNYIIKATSGAATNDSTFVTRVGAVETVNDTQNTRLTNLEYKSPNYIINGAFDIWQRGASGFTTNNGYCADRWKASISASTISRVAMPVSSGLTYGALFTTSSATNTNGIIQALESFHANSLRGKTATLSFYAQTSVAGQTLLADIQTSATADTSTTGFSVLKRETITTSTTLTRYSTSVEVPADSSSAGIRVVLLASNMPSGGTLTISGVQLEEGPTATTFRRNAPSIQAELAACQRYFWRQATSVQDGAFGYGFQTTTTTGNVQVVTPVVMRTAPTIPAYSGLQWTDGIGFNQAGTPSLVYGYTGNTITIAFGFSAGNGAARWPGRVSGTSAGSYIDYLAEI